MITQLHHEAGEYAVRAGPAVTATGLHLFGFPIADVVQLAVLLYTILQIGLFVYNRVHNYLKDKANGS